MTVVPNRDLSPRLFVSAWLLLGLLTALPVAAQPSDGPHGPIAQSYPVPEAAHVYFVAPDGDAAATGMSLAAPTTIEAAIARVVTGDAIVMRGGTYRIGGLQLNQGITIQPYLDEVPVLKGTQVATQWQPQPDGRWRTHWATLFPAAPLSWWRRDREEAHTPLHRFNNDMVFVDGQLLQSAGALADVDAASFYIDYAAGNVYIGVDPAAKVVEITAFDIALHRPSRPVHGRASDGKGPTIRGLTFTQYAYRAIDIEGRKPSTSANEEPTDDPVGVSPEADHGKEVTGTTLENVTISFCSRVAGYFRGDGLTIRNSLISDTGTEGIYVIGSSDVLLERNVIRRNNIERLTGYFPAAVKIFNQSHRVVVRDNRVLENPDSNGVWYDVGNVDGVFVDNYVEGAQNGFFFEISRGAIVVGNVFVDNQQGIRILNSAGARVYHNTFLNSPALFERNERSAQGDHFGWHPQTGPDVDEREGHVFAGNLLIADSGFGGPLLRFEQPDALCGTLTRPMATSVDGNAYLHVGEIAPETAAPLVIWSPVAGTPCKAGFASLDAWRQAAVVEAHGITSTVTPPLSFPVAGDRRSYLLRNLTGGLQDVAVAAEARDVLGWSESTHVPGAYDSATPAAGGQR